MQSKNQENSNASLHPTDHHYRMLLEKASVGLFMANPDGQFSLANPAGCALVGYTERELRQMNLRDVFTEEGMHHYSIRLEDLLAGKEVRAECQLRRKDGTFITVEINAKLLSDGSLQGSVQDVTGRKKMESQLRKSEARFRSLVEQSPISTVIYQANGNMLLFNQAACDLWQMSIEEAENLLATYNILQDEQLERQGLMPYIKKGFAGEVTQIPMFKYMSAQQETVNQSTSATQWVSSYIYPVKDDEGNVREVVILHEDITERQQIEEMLRQAQKQDSLGVLAGGVAHDFNNLLVAMLGQISLAQAKLPAASPAHDHMKKAITAAEHAAELTRQLLAYSGKGHFEVSAIDLNDLIQENLHLFNATVPKNVSLCLNPARNLPLIEGDVGQFQQLIMNLIINAAEAIGERPGTVSITTGAQKFTTVSPRLWHYTGQVIPPGRYVSISISDDGIGMNSDTLRHIFDPFYTTKATGRGLGLAAVLGIVRGQKGGLKIESFPNKGTTFQLYFPVSQTNLVESAADQTALPTQSMPQTRFVLVIDDEKVVLEAVVDILELAGLKAITAVNGEAGIQIYRERQPEILLVLLDLSMPGLNGIETLKRLKQIDPQVKVILSSGYSQQELSRRFESPVFAGFLQKPYSTNQLIRVVRNLLK